MMPQVWVQVREPKLAALLLWDCGAEQAVCDVTSYPHGCTPSHSYDGCSCASVPCHADVMGYVVENRLTVAALHQRLRSSSCSSVQVGGCAAQSVQ